MSKQLVKQLKEHKWLLGASLVGGAVVVSVLAYLSAKDARKQAEERKRVDKLIQYRFLSRKNDILEYFEKADWCSFSRSQLEAVYTVFRQIAPKSHGDNGMMTRVEFSLICQRLGANDPLVIESLFRFWDRNHDGCITFAELVEVLDLLVNAAPLEQWKDLFASYDIDGNGSLSFDEFLQMFKAFFPKAHNESVEAAARKKFVAMDINADRKVTLTEFTEMAFETGLSMSTSFNADIAHFFGLDLRGTNFDKAQS